MRGAAGAPAGPSREARALHRLELAGGDSSLLSRDRLESTFWFGLAASRPRVGVQLGREHRAVAYLAVHSPRLLASLCAATLASAEQQGAIAGQPGSTILWRGGFEPFGRAYTVPSAQESGIFLRFPGQWFDEAWEESSLGAAVYYNVHRWYENQTGRHTRVDPLGLGFGGSKNLYLYGRSNPLRFTDPMGLFEIDPNCDGKCGEFNQRREVDKAIPEFQKAIDVPRCKNLLSMHKGNRGRNLHRLMKECDSTGMISCDCSDYANYGRNNAFPFRGPVIILCGGNFAGPAAENSPFQRGAGLGETIFHECLHFLRFGGTEPAHDNENAALFRQLEKECFNWPPE